MSTAARLGRFECCRNRRRRPFECADCLALFRTHPLTRKAHSGMLELSPRPIDHTYRLADLQVSGSVVICLQYTHESRLSRSVSDVSPPPYETPHGRLR